MNKKIQHKESRGLPGGPNEMFTYTTGIFSTEGFRMDSPDVNNYENIIPSGSITMKERDGSPLRKGPIHGVDNLGNEQVMYPGYDYEFPGTEVKETLLAKHGGGLLDKTIKCSSCGWEWKAADGGSDIYDCHKCPGKGLVKAQPGYEIPKMYPAPSLELQKKIQSFVAQEDAKKKALIKEQEELQKEIKNKPIIASLKPNYNNAMHTDTSGPYGQGYTQEEQRYFESNNIPTHLWAAEKKRLDEQAVVQRRKDVQQQAIKDLNAGNFTTARAENLGNAFRLFPEDANSFIDNYINPFQMVGSMAGNLGRHFASDAGPLDLKALALDVAAPLAVGAIGGLGAKSTGQFVNNIVNPLAGLNPIKGLKNKIAKSAESKILSDKNLVELIDGVPYYTETGAMMARQRLERARALSSPPIIRDLDFPTFNRPSNLPPPVPVIRNKSGLTQNEILERVSSKDKDAVSKLSYQEFQNTVLKPNGEIAIYNTDEANSLLRNDEQIHPLDLDQYVSQFNSKLDVYSDMISKRNKSGVEYNPLGLAGDGKLFFNTPKQLVQGPTMSESLQANIARFNKNPKDFLVNKAGMRQVGDKWVLDSEVFNSVDDAVNFAKNEIDRQMGSKTISGESYFNTKINPGEWRGNIQDIANENYFRNIPGMEMTNTIKSVFADGIPRRGTGAYESLNDYLKYLDFGRVKPGFNSQTDFSRGLWENYINSGKAVGYYNNPSTLYGIMKQDGGEQEFARPADLPTLPGDAGNFNNWLYEKADKRQKRLQAEFDVKDAADKEARYINKTKYSDLLTAEFYGPDRAYEELTEEEQANINNIHKNRKASIQNINLVSADLTKKGIKAGYDPNLHTMYVPEVPTDRGVHSHEFSHMGDQAIFEEGVNPGVGTYFTEQLAKSIYPKQSPDFLNQPSSLKKNKTVGQNIEEGFNEADYLQDPSEVKARLRALRDSSIQQGYKLLEPDYNINKYKEGFNKEEKKQYEQLKKSGLSDDKINEMMYLFANNDQAQLPVGKNGLEVIAQNGGEETSWSDYLNPMNWGVSNRDDAGTFKQAFRAARIEGDSDFLYKGKRYSTELKSAVAPAKPKGITPELLIRQAYRESAFNPNAVSPAGYKGLGQIGDGVIKDYKKANNITGSVDPFNMKQNSEVQKYSMNELYNSSFINKPGQSEQVRLAKTLAAYNWGRTNVANLLNDLKEDGVDIYNSLDWISKLPDEPKKYINDILLQKNTTFNTDFSKALGNQKNLPIKRLYGFRDGGESKPGPLMQSYNRLPMEKKMGGAIVNKKEFGGQLNSGNITMYKDYIKGNIENETEALKNYDKLNRIYYSKAKELGMSAANYIMTYVAGNS